MYSGGEMYLIKRSKIYYVEYFCEESQKNRRITTCCKNKRDATKFLTKFKSSFKEEEPEQIPISLSAFEKEHTEFIRNTYSPTYYKTVILTFKIFQKYTEDIPLTKINFRLAERYIMDTYARSREGARTYYIVLRAAFYRALKWNYITENPFAKFKLPRRRVNNPIFLTESEFNELLTVVDDPLFKRIIILAFYTGLRRAELVNLKWEHINLDKRELYVRNTSEFTVKGKRERTVPLMIRRSKH